MSLWLSRKIDGAARRFRFGLKTVLAAKKWVNSAEEVIDEWDAWHGHDY